MPTVLAAIQWKLRHNDLKISILIDATIHSVQSIILPELVFWARSPVVGSFGMEPIMNDNGPRYPPVYCQLMSAAWFVDGAYAMKCWGSLRRADKLDYLKLRELLEGQFLGQTANDKIEDEYYFNADPEPPTAKQNAFHNALQFPPPTGPGLRVKLYWL
jgi:hypothetical protein